MLELKNIKKTYKVGDIETKALDDISISFREKEFVAILGTSGSGKTTCLNIIGGLDRYDSGDLIIKGKRTADFKDKDWDAYRNNSIGFVFQSYNLISHLSIVANVEMGMTLSGVSSSQKHQRALEVLEQVGLKEHLHKKPNQLSGGQMQRVAIARALANDPEILLCDEPTGALDTNTSVQILDLIKEVAKDKLVIMVTHNPELAHEYADRIVEFKDGKIISDSHPHQERPKEDAFLLKKTSMSFLTALGLSFNNLRTKKGRTFLTAFASSIGIIGIAVVLSLSTGFQKQIDDYQADAMSEFPLFISQSVSEVTEEAMMDAHESMENRARGTAKYADTDEVELYDAQAGIIQHKNNLNDEFLSYLNKTDKEICSSIGYVRLVSLNMVRKDKEDYRFVSLMAGNMGSDNSSITSMNGIGLSAYPSMREDGAQSYVEKNYELVAGEYPKDKSDLVLVIETTNKIDMATMASLGFETKDVKTIKFDDIVGTEYHMIDNDDYYVKTPMGTYMPNVDEKNKNKSFQAMYDSKKCKSLKISGIVRVKQGVSMGLLATGIAYSDQLCNDILEQAGKSQIVKDQKKSDVNLTYYTITNDKGEFTEEEKETVLALIGGVGTPYMIMLYPTNFENKDKLVDYLNKYNEGKSDEDTIIFTDLAASISQMTGGIMDAITMVLIAFSAVSLIVSLIMICIITYTSVLERTKEIGILKALGARKKDVTRVFDAETCILGVFSGLLGVFIAYLLTFPINSVIYDATELEGVAHLQLLHALLLVAVSTILTMIGGHVPAKMASKRDAVEALRSE